MLFGRLAMFSHCGNAHAHDVLITLFTLIPPHITKQARAETLCQDATDPSLSSASTFLVPPLPTRRHPFPALSPAIEFTAIGTHRAQSAMDVVLSGIGWISLTGMFDATKFKLWLPGGRKELAALRPPLMPFEYRKWHIETHRLANRVTRRQSV